MKKGLLSAACLGMLLALPACCWKKCGTPRVKDKCTPCPKVCYTEEVPVAAKREVTVCKTTGPVYFDCGDGQQNGEAAPAKKVKRSRSNR